jgi:hypothetical protein
MQTPVGYRPFDGPLLDAWFELNYRLQEEAIDSQINKTFIDPWMMRLWTIVSPRPQFFRLFLARINELALVCASRYVDCCEFAAAEELMVLPGSVLLHVEEGMAPRPPDRGGRPGRNRERILVKKKAGLLLPRLYDLLKGSGYITEDYLLSVSRRTARSSRWPG